MRTSNRKTLFSLLACGLLTLTGCASLPWAEDPTPPPTLLELGIEPLALEAMAVGCPYSDVYLAMSSNGHQVNAEIAERVRAIYSEELGKHGFQVSFEPTEAYWSAFSLVTLSERLRATFSWSVYMLATTDLVGDVRAPMRFAAVGDNPQELSGFMMLKEVQLKDLEDEAKLAAEETAVALLPHASRMCLAWVHDEGVRAELAHEIQRVRAARSEGGLERRLELEVDLPAELDSPPSDS